VLDRPLLLLTGSDETSSQPVRESRLRRLARRFRCSLDDVRPGAHERHFLAHHGSRRTQAALSDRRPRRSGDPSAWLRGNIAHVEADHAATVGTIHGDCTGLARNRRLSDPGRRPGYEDCSHSHACSGDVLGAGTHGGGMGILRLFTQAATDFAQLAQTKLSMPVLAIAGEKSMGGVLGQRRPT